MGDGIRVERWWGWVMMEWGERADRMSATALSARQSSMSFSVGAGGEAWYGYCKCSLSVALIRRNQCLCIVHCFIASCYSTVPHLS